MQMQCYAIVASQAWVGYMFILDYEEFECRVIMLRNFTIFGIKIPRRL